VNDKQGGRTTDFGFAEVPWTEKARKVRGVFDSVAHNYDLMNDLMSGWAHRLWKRYFVATAAAARASACSTSRAAPGTSPRCMARRSARTGDRAAADINARCWVGRDRLTDRGLVGSLRTAQADAEALPFRRPQLRPA
jgi:demethylmenaquinone methyltransferase / 2-methoxy-6-polyprenyl-1,4-benzoquinol methylase